MGLEVTSLLIHNKYFRHLTTCRSIECGCLTDGRLIEVRLYFLADKNIKKFDSLFQKDNFILIF